MPAGENLWNDEVYGYDGDDTIFVTNGNTWIQAGDGNDTVFGGADEDRISGGAGSDELYGGDGDDVYRFDGSIGFNTISDTSGHDTIVIEASAGGGNWGTFYQDGADLVYIDKHET